MVLTTISSLSAPKQAACRAAIAASSTSYCPYSNFAVGAALVHADGSITQGANWENCTFQVTCAERCAIVCANVQGKRTAVACAVYGAVVGSALKEHKNDMTSVSPCGLCRQMLTEVAQLGSVDMEILMVTNSQTHADVVPLSSLLPFAFGPGDAGLDISKYLDSGAATTAKKGAAAKVKTTAKATPKVSSAAKKKKPSKK